MEGRREPLRETGSSSNVARVPPPPPPPSSSVLTMKAGSSSYIDRWLKRARTNDDDGDDTHVKDENAGDGIIQVNNKKASDKIQTNIKTTVDPTQANGKSPVQMLRDEIKNNWKARCGCGGGVQELRDRRGGNHHIPTCKSCRQANEFTNLVRHKEAFLNDHLLPLSRAMSYNEMTAYTNESIVRRVNENIADGKDHLQTYPLASDYDSALRVVGTWNKLRISRNLFTDEYGFIRDGKYVSIEQQLASEASWSRYAGSP
ncbi:hypothetical protein B0T19DRAFT_403300 [Cercophora scortea]|uniref:Uncharacterized protein n=1 Tax=Cercophora scortea TaxID=314031 RepID=A0AAE0M6S8_9PEZI|nr:hypothetical protein B0T19DRAFT_403300 [Cercophora scortea]